MSTKDDQLREFGFHGAADELVALRAERDKLRDALRAAQNDFSEQVFYWDQPEQYRAMRHKAQDRIEQVLRETGIHK